VSTPVYLLDTDIVIYSARGRYRAIADRIATLEPDAYAISVITRAELMLGLHQADPSHPSQLRIRQFLAEVRILDWRQDAADTYAQLRFQLQVKGMSIDHLDLMIAAHAVSLNAILVTNNTRHFGRLAPLLTMENWVDTGR
jgi:tRNA(fMet)-specific endonuclease VapC